MSTQTYLNPDVFQSHPLNARIYGPEKLDPEFVESIRVKGILEPVVIMKTKAGPLILSGHRRVAAAKRVGRTVPVRALPEESEIWQESFLLESNRQRVKTPEQKAREFTELKRIEGALAKEREHDRKTTKAKLPESSKGQARDKAAAKVGLKPRTLEKLEKVVKAADAGNTVARAALDEVNAGTKSVHAAEQAIHPVAATEAQSAEAINPNSQCVPYQCPIEGCNGQGDRHHFRVDHGMTEKKADAMYHAVYRREYQKSSVAEASRESVPESAPLPRSPENIAKELESLILGWDFKVQPVLRTDKRRAPLYIFSAQFFEAAARKFIKQIQKIEKAS